MIALETKKNRNFDNEVDRACINDMPVEKRRPSIAIEDLLNPDSHGDSLGQDDEETRDAADDVGEVKIARAGRVSTLVSLGTLVFLIVMIIVDRSIMRTTFK